MTVSRECYYKYKDEEGKKRRVGGLGGKISEWQEICGNRSREREEQTSEAPGMTVSNESCYK